MDATLGSKNARSSDDAALPPSVQQATKPTSSSSPPAAAAGDAGAETRRAEEDDDEQVERFYALLDNIRAMRGVFRTMASAKRKWPVHGRGEEQPWRPAFRIEDFEPVEVDSEVADSGRRKRTRTCASGRRMPPGRETGAVVDAADNDNDRGGDVV